MDTQPEKKDALKSNTMMSFPDVCLQDEKWVTQKQDGELLARYQYSKGHMLCEWSMVQKSNRSAINDAIKETTIKCPCGDTEVFEKFRN